MKYFTIAFLIAVIALCAVLAVLPGKIRTVAESKIRIRRRRDHIPDLGADPRSSGRDRDRSPAADPAGRSIRPVWTN